MPLPSTTTPPRTAPTYMVIYPVGALGWRECSGRMYEAILAKPETYSGVKLARIEKAVQRD